MLAAGAGSPVDLHLDVRRVQLHIHFLHLRQHRHGGSGGMDPAPGLRLRHPLDPVDAGLILHPGIGPPAVDDKVRLLDAAQLRVVVVHQLHGPALSGGVHGIHPEQAVGKQGAFLPAHAATDLHNDALVVVGVLGKQQELDFPGQTLLFRLCGGVGFLAQLLHFRLRHQLLGIRHFRLRPSVGPVGGHDGFQVVFLPQQGSGLFGVRVEIRLLGFGAELFVSVSYFFQFIQHGFAPFGFLL